MDAGDSRHADPLAHHRRHRHRSSRSTVLRWLYRRSTKETAFVRTGFLGEKVVVNGGAFVIPVAARDHARQHERAAHRGAARASAAR